MNQMELFDGEPIYDYTRKNPMVVAYGKGPDGTRCKTCDHLCIIQPGQNTYNKCKIRGITHGPGTDHRVNYAACARYKQIEEEST
jgi:hypothetical protein